MATHQKQSNYYNGNPNIKKAGVAYDYTKDEIAEYVKCSEDPIYFIRKYVKIISLDDGLVNFDMRDYQERMIDAYHNNRFCVTLTSRQTGKSITVAAYILHYILFNAETTTVILANKAATAREILSRIKRMFENLPSFLQIGVKEYNKGSIILANDTTLIAAATSSDSIRGLSVNCVTKETQITICDEYNRIYNIDIQNANSSKYKYNKDYNLYGNNMYYTIYRIKNTINNKEYIGYHQTDNLNDGYMGSGKLIKLAIEKHGISNFKKEILEIFDNKEDAENLERILVNEEYTLNPNTYNLAIGGNVRILVGENNGFYGKKHSKEFKDCLSNQMSGSNKYLDDDILVNDIRYNSFSHALVALNTTTGKLIKLLTLDGNGYINEERQANLIKADSEIEQRKINNRIAQSKICSIRFKGAKKSTETKLKISTALSGKKKSIEHVNKINKNPDKIRKTAKTHTGMVRSKEARLNISLSKKGKPSPNKGKVYCYNKITLERKLCNKSDIPLDWVRGYTPKEI